MGATDDDRRAPEHEPVEGEHVTSKYAIGDAGSQAFDFFSSVLAGMLLGLGIDWLAGTRPVFVIVGIIAGFISGFVKLWFASEAIEEEARRRGRL